MTCSMARDRKRGTEEAFVSRVNILRGRKMGGVVTSGPMAVSTKENLLTLFSKVAVSKFTNTLFSA